MKTTSRVAVASILSLLVACGKPLGTYTVREVSVVPGEAVKIIEPNIDPSPQMLRIEFTSKTDMYEASDGGGEGLYVMSSLCPYNGKAPIYVSDVYYNDQSRYGPTRVLERKVLPDGRVFERVEGQDRRPTKNPATGEFTYTTYIRLSGTGSVDRGDGQANSTTYDLRRQARDLCLRIDHPGYFITPSRSRVFTIPGAMIRSALLQGQQASVQPRP